MHHIPLLGKSSWSNVNTDVTDWAIFFAAGVDVAVGDGVRYNGIAYKNLTGEHTDTAPDTDTTNWVALSA